MRELKFPLIPAEVKAIIQNWISEEKNNYTWEIRAVYPVLYSYPSPALCFVIDVKGFYRDDKEEEPVVLHEKYIFPLNSDLLQTQPNGVAFHLSSALKKFTEATYNAFDKRLKDERDQSTIYTSDPLFWNI